MSEMASSFDALWACLLMSVDESSGSAGVLTGARGRAGVRRWMHRTLRDPLAGERIPREAATRDRPRVVPQVIRPDLGIGIAFGVAVFAALAWNEASPAAQRSQKACSHGTGGRDKARRARVPSCSRDWAGPGGVSPSAASSGEDKNTETLSVG
eukprot:5226904-Prymnesium_polylepis.2